jgi:4-oxalocrotonate tautomerase
MPILNVKVSQPPSEALVESISELLYELTTRILRKKRKLTSIAIDFVPPENWVVGGATLAAQRINSFYFDIKIVDSTNTKDEKSAYIAACFAGFEKLIAPLHAESYIHVQDVRAEAYGFGGFTQEYRYIKAKL